MNSVQAHWIDCNILQHTATHCNTLEHTATQCNILQIRCNATGKGKNVLTKFKLNEKQLAKQKAKIGGFDTVYLFICVTHTHTRMYTYIQVYAHIYVYTYICVYIYICMYVSICICSHSYVCIYLCLYISNGLDQWDGQNSCIHVCSTRAHRHTCMYIYIHKCIYICI